MAYEGKARGLIALHRNAEAKQVLDEAIRQAQAQNALGAEAQLLVVRGKQESTVNPQQAIKVLVAATDFCKEGARSIARRRSWRTVISPPRKGKTMTKH